MLIGASLSEPHINGTAVRELYIYYYYYYYYYGTSVTRNICPVWLYGYKREIFYCAFSCLGYAPYIRRSNLVNCKFTLVPACSKAKLGATVGIKLYRAGLQRRRERDRARRQLNRAQGPAKNVTKIDVLLTDSDNRGRLNIYLFS